MVSMFRINKLNLKFVSIFLVLIIFKTPISFAKPLKKKAQKTETETQQCLKLWPSLSIQAEEKTRLTNLGQLEIKQAGEHPSKQSITRIVDLLGKAASANSTEAQRAFGFYIFGYWMTDEMFWPRQKKIAIQALAMLRIYALKELERGPIYDSYVSYLAQTPPLPDEEIEPLPKAWLKEALRYADRWINCYRKVNQFNPIDQQQ